MRLALEVTKANISITLGEKDLGKNLLYSQNLKDTLAFYSVFATLQRPFGGQHLFPLTFL